MILRVLKLLLSICITIHTRGQISVKGVVVDSNKTPIGSVSVLLLQKNSVGVKAFSITDKTGNFDINFSEILDSFILRFSCINYETKEIKLNKNYEKLIIVLQNKNTILPEIEVKAKPIRENGDTLKYSVSEFSNKNDRVIGDVIAKLPGIEVDADGKISYNGKAISHYYIDGLDLLDTRYNVANKNINFDLVDQVQVLTNNKHIKVLDSLKRTNETAINIKLNKKAKNKLIGNLNIGIGLNPLLWDNEVLGMTFKKNIQSINAYKSNNTGIDLSNEIQNNAIINEVGNQSESNTKEEFFTIIKPLQPRLSGRRYNFNNTNLIYVNILKVLKNGNELKFNMSCINDKKRTIGNNTSTYYNLLDTTKIVEDIYNNIKIKELVIGLDYAENKKESYLKNNLNITISKVNNFGLLFNGNNIDQNLFNPFIKYSNKFNLIKKVNSNYYTFNSTFDYNTTPQEFSITPGQFSAQFNQTLNYDKLTQYEKLHNFNTNNNVSFSKKIFGIRNELKIGDEYVNKNLTSSLEKLYNNGLYKLNDSFSNNLNFIKNRAYISTEFIIKKKNKQLVISLPFEYQFFNVNNKIKNTNTISKFFLINPTIDINFTISNSFQFQANIVSQNILGNINQTLTGFTLKNYRSIGKNESNLQNNKQLNVSANVAYKNPLIGIFGYLSANLTNTINNLITAQSISGIFITTQFLNVSNTQKSKIIQGNINKYIYSKKINLSLNVSNSNVSFYQFWQNNKILIQNNSNTIQFKINYNGSKLFTIDNSNSFQKSTNLVRDFNSLNNNYSFTSNVKLNFSLSKNLTLSSLVELYKIWNEKIKVNYFFTDIVIRYKIKRQDIELNLLNITNNEKYIIIYNSNNFVQINQLKIRPFQAIIKAHFSL